MTPHKEATLLQATQVANMHLRSCQRLGTLHFKCVKFAANMFRVFFTMACGATVKTGDRVQHAQMVNLALLHDPKTGNWRGGVYDNEGYVVSMDLAKAFKTVIAAVAKAEKIYAKEIGAAAKKQWQQDEDKKKRLLLAERAREAKAKAIAKDKLKTKRLKPLPKETVFSKREWDRMVVRADSDKKTPPTSIKTPRAVAKQKLAEQQAAWPFPTTATHGSK